MRSREKLRQWFIYIKRHTKYENKLFRQLRELFKEQERIVLANLRSQVSEDRAFKQAFDIETIIFNEKEEVERFLDATTPIVTSVVDDAGRLAIRNLGLTIDFDILDPHVVNYINQETFRTIVGITRTTAEKLRDALHEGITQGETPYDLTNRIREVFKGTVRGTGPRARLIARTEITKFANKGLQAGWDQTGIVSVKQWYTARDERVRPAHVAVDGVEVPISGKFVVGGMQMEHPGDPAGGAKNVCNCRCTMLASQITE